MKATADAPGKLVLLGDHAVVYGHPGIVTAVDHRYRVSASALPGPVLRIRTPAGQAHELPLEATAKPQHRDIAYVAAAVNRLHQVHESGGGLLLVTSGPERSYGLGSSSAITVATLAAAARLYDLDLSLDQLYGMARSAVLDVQGAGSGLDVAAAVYGGTCYLERSGELPERLALDGLPLVMGYSGKKVGTVDLLRQVATLHTRHPDLVGPLLGLVGRVCIRARSCLEDGRWRDLGALLDFHQGLLDALGVNSIELARLVDAARRAGAWGAKLSGAGGGDCMFALAESAQRAEVAAAIQAAGGQVLEIACHAPGVRVRDGA